MSWARVLLYYAVAAVLTFHLLGVARERAGEAETPVAATAPFLEAVPERIDRVRMEADNQAVQFERKDGKWITTEPEGLAPPGDVVDAVIESFATLPPIEIVSDAGAKEDQFGLVPPRVRIRLEQQGSLVSTIVLGELSPTRTAVYAKKSGSEDVALIGLNAKYYIDLVFENVRRQKASGGVATPEGGALKMGTPEGGAVRMGTPEGGALKMGTPEGEAVRMGTPGGGALNPGMPDGEATPPLSPESQPAAVPAR